MLTHAHFITGATSQIGQCLLPRLQAAGLTYTAFSRQPPSIPCWQSIDLKKDSLPITEATTLFHLAGIPLLPPALERLPLDTPLKRVIAFSSTSRYTKLHSPVEAERKLAAQLAAAEEAVITACTARGIAWTIFRPTLIYGCGKDQTVTFIQQIIAKYGFFPLVGAAQGKRQPVHADDLALACLQANANPQTYGQSYNLSGGQTLTYRDMVTAIFHQMHKKPRLLSIPLPLFHLATHLLKIFPRFRHLTTEMATRMNHDLIFDHEAATRDFGYMPRNFS